MSSSSLPFETRYLLPNSSVCHLFYYRQVENGTDLVVNSRPDKLNYALLKANLVCIIKYR